jgi:hypothetical protein
MASPPGPQPGASTEPVTGGEPENNISLKDLLFRFMGAAEQRLPEAARVRSKVSRAVDG